MLRLQSNFKVRDVIGKNITFANPYSWQLLEKLDANIIDKFLIYADGILLVKLYNAFKIKEPIGRFSFDDTSLAPIVFLFAKEQKLSVFLVGGKEGITCSAKMLLESKYPGLNIIGTSSGYFDSLEHKAEIMKNASASDIVISAMGTPYQELFLDDLRKLGWLGTGFTCGGYLDQLVASKGKSYYPPIVDKFHLRAVYRLFSEPSRLWKRYFVLYPKFVLTFVFEGKKL